MPVFRTFFLALLLLLLVPHSKEEPKEEPKEEEKEEEEEEHLPGDSPSPGNCSVCAEETRARKEMRLQGIRAQILGSLGLTEPPNVSRAQLPHVPPISDILSNYAHQRDQAHPFSAGPEYDYVSDEEYGYATTKKVLSFQHNPPRPHLREANGARAPAAFLTKRSAKISYGSTGEASVPFLEPGDRQLYFRFSPKMHGQHVQSAHLWIHLPRHKGLRHHNLTLFQVERQDMDLLLIKRKSGDKKGPRTKGHWLIFDVKKSVSHWMKYPKENLGFVLRHSHEHTDSNHAPFIEVEVELSRGKSRQRRMIGLNCEENADEVRCCRYPLTVDFEEFGWDWIIAPKRYEANYCSGECPYVFLQKYPHTHLVQQANPQGSAGPCCAPRKMSSISMLYFDADYNIIYGMLPGMVVDRCGCS